MSKETVTRQLVEPRSPFRHACIWSVNKYLLCTGFMIPAIIEHTGNTSTTSFVHFDVGMKCKRVWDAFDVSHMLAIAFCLILREASLLIWIL